MKLAGIRCVIDDSDNHNPGFKFNFWEVRGVPVRLELGSKDFEKSEVKCCLRHNGEKFQMTHDGLSGNIQELL